MILNRRILMSCMLVGLVAATSARARVRSPGQDEGAKGMPVKFPPFELQASPEALQRLTAGLSGWRVERIGEKVSHIWLRTSDAAVWLVGVDQRDVKPLFEVFTLSMLSMDELTERWRLWQPPTLPPDTPENIRLLLTTRPPALAMPTDFDPWPFRSWRTDVVRRTEFIIETAAVGQTVGDGPNAQSATRPSKVPVGASASCEVAAGVLFTGEDGRKLLLAVDWMPTNMLVIDDPAEIDAFTATCELVAMSVYAPGVPAAG